MLLFLAFKHLYYHNYHSNFNLQQKLALIKIASDFMKSIDNGEYPEC